MRLLDAIKSSSDYLERSGVADHLVDAELLVLHAARIDRLRAYMDNPVIDQKLRSRINRLVRGRASGEPLQYIIGEVDFLGLRIGVGKGVLIPRPETELLAQEAVNECKRRRVKSLAAKDCRGKAKGAEQLLPFDDQPLAILDLCTGSGCIALALAKEFPAAQVYATDVSARALKYAKGNAECNGVKNVVFLKGSLFGPVESHMAFDLITANPPYIRTSDISGLQREIRDWEPVEALDGGSDGLDFYRVILSKAAGYLKDYGSILLELGFGQAKDAKELAGNAGFKTIEIIKDFAGIDRVLKTRK
jgi:release factor glutamine methyltransferase